MRHGGRYIRMWRMTDKLSCLSASFKINSTDKILSARVQNTLLSSQAERNTVEI